MTAPRGKSLLGRWRIVETDLWDTEYLDMLEPAHITFRVNGEGEFAFGCINASMRCDYASETVFFTWAGFDENDEVSGEGAAELDGEDTLTGEISFHNGDETEFKARRF